MIKLNYIGINNPNAQESYYFSLGNTAANTSRFVIENLSFKVTDGRSYDWSAIIGVGDPRVFSAGDVIRFDLSVPYTEFFNDVEFATVEYTPTKFIINGTEYLCTPRKTFDNITLFNASSNTNQVKEGTIGTISIYDSNDVLTYKFVPCIDDNDNLAYYDEVNDNYIYPNSQTYFYSGSVASTIIVDSDIKAVPASGGTINITVDSESNWSAATTDMSVTVTDYFESQGSSVYYLSAITQNYPSVGTFNLLQVYIPSSPEEGYVTVFLEDGVLHCRTTEVWGGSSTITIHDNYAITFFGARSNITWKPLEDYYKPSDLLTFSTAGTPSDTAITITIPSTTATTQKEATIYFINEVGDKDQLTIKQRKYSVGGIRLIDIGESEVETFYIGNDEVELIYMGEEIVYEKGQGPTPTPTPTQPQAAFLWTNDGEIHVISEVEGELVFPTLSNGVDYYMVNTTDDLDEITTEKMIFGLVDEDDGFYLDIYKKIDGWKILYDSGNGEVEESCGLAIGETISIQDFGFEFEVIENGFVFNFTNNIFETIGLCEIYGENDGDEIEQNNVRFVYVDDGENTPYWDAVGCEYVCKACFEMVNGNIGERTVNKSDCPYLVNDRGYGVIFYVSYWGGGNEQIALMNVTDDYYGKALYLNANKSIKFGDTTINQGTVNASVGNYYVSNKKNSTEEWIEILPSNGNSRLTISNLY